MPGITSTPAMRYVERRRQAAHAPAEADPIITAGDGSTGEPPALALAWNTLCARHSPRDDLILALAPTRREITPFPVQVTQDFGGQSNFWPRSPR